MVRKRSLSLLFLVFVITTLFCGCASTIRREPEGQYVQVNGKRLWYRMEGKGPPLLLVPGGPGFPHTYFWPHFSILAKEFKVIYFDPYGRGKSDRAPDPAEYSFAGDVDEIEALRRELGLGRINLYGQSYGGMVAQAYALKYGQSLNHLILADTFHSAEMWQKGNNDTCNFQVQNQMPELWARLQALRAKGMLSCDAEYQKAEGEIPVGLFYYYDPSSAGRVGDGAMDLNLDVYRRIAGPDADVVLGGDLAAVDFRSRLKEITVPTLIIAGRFDRVSIPKFAIQFKEFMPQARFVMFEQSGHMPFIEEKERHATELTTFLKGSNSAPIH